MIGGSRELRVRGPVPAALAWERYAQPSLWAGWAPHLSRVRASTTRIAPGTTGTVYALGGAVRAHFRVLAVDEGARTWSWRVRVGLLRLRLTHDVVAEDGGCSAGLVIQGPSVVTLAYRPVAAWALHRLVTLEAPG